MSAKRREELLGKYKLQEVQPFLLFVQKLVKSIVWKKNCA